MEMKEVKSLSLSLEPAQPEGGQRGEVTASPLLSPAGGTVPSHHRDKPDKQEPDPVQRDQTHSALRLPWDPAMAAKRKQGTEAQ